MAIISGKTYTKIVTLGAEIYDIYPFDSFGNSVAEMVIEVDSTLGSCTLNLPIISSLNNFWNTKITIVANTGTTNPVGIKADLSDTIGGQLTLTLAGNFQAVELNVATSNTWYGVITP